MLFELIGQIIYTKKKKKRKENLFFVSSSSTTFLFGTIINCHLK
jgi:hypothetical protein